MPAEVTFTPRGVRHAIDSVMTPRTLEALSIFRSASQLGEYDSNVAGMVGEIIAEEYYGMKKASAGNEGSDGDIVVDGHNRTVQVKAWTARRVLRYKGSTLLRLPNPPKADRILHFLIVPEAPWCFELLNENTAIFQRPGGQTSIELSWNKITKREMIQDILGQLA